MLDHHLFIHQLDTILPKLRLRGVSEATLLELQQTIERRRQHIQQVETLRSVSNQASQALMQLPAEQRDAERQRLKAFKKQIKDAEDVLLQIETAFEKQLLQMPNLPGDDTPVGENENHNVEVRRFSEPHKMAFEPKTHWQLLEDLGLLDFSRAGKMSGSRFAILKGDLARLERALAAFMLDTAAGFGYVAISPPLLVKTEAMQAVGQYPKFIGESFETLDRAYVLIPTAEVCLVSLHSDEIIASEQLPLRYVAYTPCFRKEAGAAGRDTRGLIRQHQFYKVELVSLTPAEQSQQEHEQLTLHAETILQRLDLPYRLMSLCTGDLGFASQKTYDLEVWLPGQAAFREISSCSNCGDFQARRAQIRHRPTSNPQGKPQFLHTLNGSALAVGRTLVAVCENYQQADGRIAIPEVLWPYMAGLKVLG